jgi:general secretion pathway protein D
LPVGRRSAHVGAAVIFFAVAGAALAACDLTSGLMPAGQNGTEPPDASDQVRNADLKPRFPLAVQTDDTGSKTPRPSVYYGTGTERPRVSGIEPTPDGSGYELNFENTPIATVTKVVLGDILGVGYTIDPRVQGTITLASGRPIAQNDILFVLESALRTANAVLVRDKTGYRLLPAADAVGAGGVDRATAGNSPEPGYGITIIPLQYVSVQTVSKLLDSFAMKPGAIRADTSRNLLVIQGSGAERRAAVNTVLDFDADWMRGQSVGIYPVRNSTPEPLITELEKIMDSGEGGLSGNLVKLQPISRQNAILVVARKPELLQIAATWIGRLDNSQTASTGVKVYRVRYGDARVLARLLNDMYVGGSQGSLDSATNQLAPAAGVATTSSDGGATSMSPADRLTGGTAALATVLQQQPGGGAQNTAGAGANAVPGAAPRSGAVGGGPILPGVRISADVTNNALLIYANQESYRVIERTLNQLDRPQLQVAFDATIAEVTLNDNLNYGVQFFLQNNNIGFNSPVGSVVNSAATIPLAQVLPGFNFLIGAQASPQLVLNALHNYTDVKVLSNPSLVVVDHGVATLQVGDQVPITTGTATVLSANNAVVNTISYQNTGIILRIVPRINSNGSVLLDIEQEISEVAPSTAAGSLTPTISERKVKSTLSVVDGQTVLLAGLISDTQNVTRSGVPGVDQIPYFGDVFSQNQKAIVRTELIVFIRPQIIRDSVDASVVAEELRAKLRGSKVGSVRPPGAVLPLTPEVVR